MPRPVSSATPGTAPARKPVLKNPLRTATMSLGLPPSLAGGPGSPAPDAVPPAPEVTAQQVRQMQVSEFAAWMRTQTSPKTKRPFQEQTIVGYSEAARVLDRWMESQGIEGDFTACDVAMLNRFFADYHREHGQGGTNNRQRNLHHLFKWLAMSLQATLTRGPRPSWCGTGR